MAFAAALAAEDFSGDSKEAAKKQERRPIKAKIDLKSKRPLRTRVEKPVVEAKARRPAKKTRKCNCKF